MTYTGKRSWFDRMPVIAQRAAFVAAALGLTIATLAFSWWQPLMGILFSPAIAGTVFTLLARAFGSGRFKALIAAGRRLDLPYDRRTGQIRGRLRGIPVRVFPTLHTNPKAQVEVWNGMGAPTISEPFAEPYGEGQAEAIVAKIEELVAEAERAQHAVCDEAVSLPDPRGRRSAVRMLAAIPTDARTTRVVDALACACADTDPRVRLAATHGCGNAIADEACALSVLAEGDVEGTVEAAAALSRVGGAAALAALVTARDTGRASTDLDRAILAIRARTGVDTGRIALSGTETDGSLSVSTTPGAITLTVKSSGS